MPRFFKKALLIPVFCLAVFPPHKALAETNIKSKYFNTRIYDGIDRMELLHKLDAGYFLGRDVANFGTPGKSSADLDALLGGALDAIYLQVCDIVDIHIYSLVIDLDIFPDRKALADTLEAYFKKRIDVPSFYFVDKNKIYVSYTDLNAGMLAHEMAHAIVCRYFAVPPPEKVQEVIAGYAEYSVRKLMSEK